MRTFCFITIMPVIIKFKNNLHPVPIAFVGIINVTQAAIPIITSFGYCPIVSHESKALLHFVSYQENPVFACFSYTLPNLYTELD